MTNLNNINSPISREERNKLNENWQLLTQRFSHFQRHLNLLAGEDVEGVITNINERIAETDAALQQIETDLVEVNGAADNANTKAELAQTAADIAEQIAAIAQEKIDFIETHEEDIEFFTSMQNNLQAQVDQLVISGDSSPEAAQARVGTDGTQHNTLKARLDSEIGQVTTQLAQTTTDLGDILSSDKVSRKVTLANTDVSQSLSTALTDYKDRNLKYAYFDEETEIKLNSVLPQRDVLFFGKTKMGWVHQDNAFYYIPNTLRSFNGKVNQNYCKFAQLKSAIAAERPINVTIWGDSISTNGDLLNVNTANPSGTEFGPDNITEGDSYTSYLYDLMAETMPDKVFNFYNRAIGGTRLSEWNSTKTINSVSKAWIEHIKDTNPDVLVVAFGMNHNTYDYARSFAYNIKQVTDYINANFTVKPDLVFVSTPRATYHPETIWGSFEGQASRQLTANVLRNVASTYKAYLLDVNRLSNIKRTGTDWTNPTFREIDPTPYISKSKDVNGNYVFSGTVELTNINKYIKDFVLKFRIGWTGALVDGDNLNLAYGKTIDTGINNSQVEFIPSRTATGLTRIRSLANIADHTNWGSGSSAIYDSAVKRDYINLRIEKRNNILEIYEEASNGVSVALLLRDKLNVWDTIGKITLRHNGATTGFTTTISNFRMFEPAYQEYLPDLTEKDAWGEFNPSNTGLKSPFGGNGVNHPSSYGVKEMYLPCVEEFVGEIANVYRNS